MGIKRGENSKKWEICVCRPLYLSQIDQNLNRYEVSESNEGTQNVPPNGPRPKKGDINHRKGEACASRPTYLSHSNQHLPEYVYSTTWGIPGQFNILWNKIWHRILRFCWKLAHWLIPVRNFQTQILDFLVNPCLKYGLLNLDRNGLISAYRSMLKMLYLRFYSSARNKIKRDRSITRGYWMWAW